VTIHVYSIEGRLCGECDVKFNEKVVALLSCGHVFVPHFAFHFVNCVVLSRPAGSSNRFKHASWVMGHCRGGAFCVIVSGH